MSSILNMLNTLDTEGLKLEILLPLFAVVAATITFLLKFSIRKPEVTKKTQNGIIKQQKIHTANSKQKEEKINGEKKEKNSKEKKLSPIPNKSLDKQAGSVTAKVNRKQQNVVDEKASKKNSTQINKNQVKNNANSKNNASAKNSEINNKKLIVEIDNNKEEGEWQMVTAKKQKHVKQEEKVEIAKTPKKTSKKSQKPLEMATQQSGNKTKKSKDVAEKGDKSAKLYNSEITKTEEIQTLNCHPKENIEIINENAVIPELETAEVDFNYNNTSITSVKKIQEIIAQEGIPIANVAFDELGGGSWTDTKPQKKNKKRALRE